MTTTFMATLGRSPGAVTGLYLDLLRPRRDGPPLADAIDQIHLFGTLDNDVRKAEKIIRTKLKNYPTTIVHEPLDDRDFRKVEAFQKLVSHRLQHATERGAVIVGVTGGQTGMGVMLAISAQFYHNVRLYHYWVDNDIALSGTIDKLSSLEQNNRPRYELILDPGSQAYRSQVIELPATHMVRQREMIEKYRSGEMTRHFNSEEANSILRLLPRRMTIEQSEHYKDILIALQNGAEPLSLLDDLNQLLASAGITNISSHLRALLRLPQTDPIVLDEWVQRVVISGEYWAEGLDTIYDTFWQDRDMWHLHTGPGDAIVSAVNPLMQALILLAHYLKI